MHTLRGCIWVVLPALKFITCSPRSIEETNLSARAASALSRCVLRLRSFMARFVRPSLLCNTRSQRTLASRAVSSTFCTLKVVYDCSGWNRWDTVSKNGSFNKTEVVNFNNTTAFFMARLNDSSEIFLVVGVLHVEAELTRLIYWNSKVQWEIIWLIKKICNWFMIS